MGYSNKQTPLQTKQKMESSLVTTRLLHISQEEANLIKEENPKHQQIEAVGRNDSSKLRQRFMTSVISQRYETNRDLVVPTGFSQRLDTTYFSTYADRDNPVATRVLPAMARHKETLLLIIVQSHYILERAVQMFFFR